MAAKKTEKTDRPLDRAELRRRASEMMSKGDDDNEMIVDTSRGDPEAAYSCLAYGPAGVGKSTFFSRRKHVYFLPVEPGVNQIRVPQYKYAIDSLDVLYAILEKLRTSRHPYEAVCLDSASAAELLIIAGINERLRKSPVKLRDGSMAKSVSDLNDDYGSGYAAVASEWQELLRRLDLLGTERAMDRYVTAHTKTETIRNIEGPDYQKYTIDLTGPKAIKSIVNWSEYTLFMRQDISIDATTKKKILASTSALSIYTRGTAAWTAKTRGEIPWPERLPLDWEVFDRVRYLVARHGLDLEPWLVARLEAAGGAPVRPVFDAHLRARQWHTCDDVCTLAERFTTVEPSIPVAARPRARQVFLGSLNELNLAVASAVCAQAEEEARTGVFAEKKIEVDLGVDEDGVVKIEKTEKVESPVDGPTN